MAVVKVAVVKVAVVLGPRYTPVSQGRRQDVAAGGAKNHKRGTFLHTMLDVCSNRHEESRLRHVNFIHIQLDPESYRDMNTETADHRHLMFCNLGKGRDKK